MRSGILGLVGVPCAAFALSSAAPSVANIPARTVTGRVTDALTGAPVAQLSVIVEGTTFGSITSDLGTFRLLAVPGGAQQIVFRHPCYLTVRVIIPDANDVPLPIAVPPDPTTRLVLKPGCVRFAPSNRDTLSDLAAATPSLRAQGTDPAVKGLRSEWGMTANFLRTAVERMPEPDFAYKPVASVRTFGEIIKHITATQVVLCGVALGEKSLTDGVETQSTSKADLARELLDSMEYCAKAYGQDLSKMSIDAGQRETRYYALAHNTAHNGEHYGNIATYMRMKGLVPPSSQR